MPWQKQFDVEVALERAMDLFWNRGYEATSMQDLVEHMGVQRASLYATWGDKHALFLAALRRYDATMRSERLARLEAAHGPRAAIRKLFEAFAAGAEGGRRARRGCFLTNTALELSAHDRKVSRVVARSQQEIEAFFRRSIERGQAAGEIPKAVDPATTASGLLASLIGIAVLARSRPERSLLKHVVDDALRRLDP